VSAPDAEIGVLGGSGLYALAALNGARDVSMENPVRAAVRLDAGGEVEGRRVAFLARHGRSHHLLPSEINYAPTSTP